MPSTSDVRPQTPIPEDPREDRPPSCEPTTSPVSSVSDEKPLLYPKINTPERPATPNVETKSEKAIEISDVKKDAKLETEKEKEKIPETSSTPAPVVKALISDKGKSKITGKTIGGWL